MSSTNPHELHTPQDFEEPNSENIVLSTTLKRKIEGKNEDRSLKLPQPKETFESMVTMHSSPPQKGYGLQSQQFSQPNETFGFRVTMYSPLPQKGYGLQSPQQLHQKEAFASMSTMSSSTPMMSHGLSLPSPAKKRASYREIKENFLQFNEKLQTSCKAALYDLSHGDKKSVANTLQSLIGQSKCFIDGTLPLVNKEDLTCKATTQKNVTLNTYNQHLHRENNDLRLKLKQYSEFESAMLTAVPFENDISNVGKKEEEKEEKDEEQLDECEDKDD